MALGLVAMLTGCHLVFGHRPGAPAPDARDAASDGARADGFPDAGTVDRPPLNDTEAPPDPPPPIPSHCGVKSWCWVHPRPHGNRFHAAWIDPESQEAFVVGDQGTIYHAQAGQPWQEMTSGTTRALRGVAGIPGKQIVVAVGDDGLILRYDGTSWTQAAILGKTLHAVHGDKSGLIAVGEGATVIVSGDGKAWTPFVPALAASVNKTLRAVTRDGLVAVAGDAGQIFVLPELAQTWTTHELPGTPTVRGLLVMGGDLIAVGDSGFIRRWDGLSWQAISAGATETLHGIAGGADASGNLIAVAVGKGTLVRIAGDWTVITSSQTRDARAVAAAGTLLVVAGGGGAILRGEVGGGSYARELPISDPLSEENLNGVVARAASLFAVGSKGTILRIDGEKIVPESAPAAVAALELTAVGGAGQGPLVAVGSQGTLLHRALFGPWQKQSIQGQIGGDLLAVGGSGAADLWAVGAPSAKDQPPVILHFDGSSWSAVAAPVDVKGKTLSGVWAGWGGVAYAVGPGIVLERKAADWVVAPLPQSYWANELRAVWGRAAEVYAVGKYVLRFDGATWRHDFSLSSQGRSVRGSGGTVVAVGEGGLVARNDGAGWSQTRVTGNNLHGVWLGAKGIWVVGEAGTILYYRDN